MIVPRKFLSDSRGLKYFHAPGLGFSSLSVISSNWLFDFLNLGLPSFTSLANRHTFFCCVNSVPPSTAGKQTTRKRSVGESHITFSGKDSTNIWVILVGSTGNLEITLFEKNIPGCSFGIELDPSHPSNILVRQQIPSSSCLEWVKGT